MIGVFLAAAAQVISIPIFGALSDRIGRRMVYGGGALAVNGGRLSVPSIYQTPLSTADCEDWRGGPRPGASMVDAPISKPGGEWTDKQVSGQG